MSWITDRLSEKHSQVALGAAFMATGAVAAQPNAWTIEGIAVWYALIPVWVGTIVHVLLPDADPNAPAIIPQTGDTLNA